jgi:hypothetical protein
MSVPNSAGPTLTLIVFQDDTIDQILSPPFSAMSAAGEAKVFSSTRGWFRPNCLFSPGQGTQSECKLLIPSSIRDELDLP